MKKLAICVLSLLMIISLFGCGNSNKDNKKGNVDSTKATENITTTKKAVTEESTKVENNETTTTPKENPNTTKAPTKHQKPVEPDSVEIDKGNENTCYLSIDCKTILNNMEDLTPGKEPLVPKDGVILPKTKVEFYEGESVFDLLQRETRNRRIHMESSFTPMYNSAYIEGIHNLYEFDCGSESGWMYCVNGWFPNYGVSRYQIKPGDVIEFHYTCDLGRDLGAGDWQSAK